MNVSMKENVIRVRFAPSPTGELHIGGLRIALACYLFAKKNDGSFVLRIEDTDRSRLVDGAIDRLIRDVKWAGLEINEGVLVDEMGKILQVGEHGPYIQSERLDIYKKFVDQLLSEKKAYHCFCSAERLRKMREDQQSTKMAPKYDRHCYSLSEKDVDDRIRSGEKYVVRFKIPDGETHFKDTVYGHVRVDNASLDDQVLLKSDGFPTYHLAVVVDDHLMEITHVLRGMEWLASTPKHVLLYRALGWEDTMPIFCHLPNILNTDRKKLSKRHGSVSVSDFRNDGYPREAIINFIALLGWNPKTKQEIFTMEELIAQFDLTKFNRAGGVFDMDRLAWMSREHIKRMTVDTLYDSVIPFLENKEFFTGASEYQRTEEYIRRVLTIEQDRLEKLSEVGEENQFFFFEDVKIDKDLLRWKENTDITTLQMLTKAEEVLINVSHTEWTRKDLEAVLMDAAGDQRGDFLWPLRAALTGAKRSPSPFDCAWVLGKEMTLARIEKALDLF
jgi:nondiscriminating glutamyl-tRNA synthetase